MNAIVYRFLYGNLLQNCIHFKFFMWALPLRRKANAFLLRVGLYAGRDVACHAYTSFANAHCGLSAAIPHAGARVHTRYVHALGMRRACVSMVRIAPKR